MGDILIIWPDVYIIPLQMGVSYMVVSCHPMMDAHGKKGILTYMENHLEKSTKLYVNIPVPFIIRIIY